MRRVRKYSLAVAAGLTLPLALGAGPASAATAAKPYDFDGDGKADLVSGAPALNRAKVKQSGGVVVSYGSGRTKVITQSTSGVAGGSEAYDYFGEALASADFDRDGYADLAVGLPGEDFSGKDNAGAVTILYGTGQGLTGKRSKQISEPSGKVQYAGFGSALATGDLNGDGYPDLVVGAPEDERDSDANDDYPASGSVTVMYGGKSGISTTGSRQLLGVRGTVDQDFEFGSGLAVADVDADGRNDVVVVSRGAQAGDANGYDGSLSYCPAGASALPSSCRRLLHERGLSTGSSVVVGNVEGDSRPEVVVGVPAQDLDGDPGGVEVVTLSGTGPGTTAVREDVTQEDAGLPGSAEETGDYFGYDVVIGDVVGDGYDDLVVGAPGEVSGGDEAGAVFVVRGGADGLATSGNLRFDQDTAGVPGSSERDDAFGAAVTLLDRDGDGRLDLSAGAPGEDDDTGRVTTLRGTSGGFTTTGAKAFGLKDIGVSSTDRRGASFGEVLGR